MNVPNQTVTTAEYSRLTGKDRFFVSRQIKNGNIRAVQTGPNGEIRIMRHQISYDNQGAPGDEFPLPEWVPLDTAAPLLGLTPYSLRRLMRNQPNSFTIRLGFRNAPEIARESIFEILGGPAYVWPELPAAPTAPAAEPLPVPAVETDEERPEFRKVIGGIVQSVIARQLVSFAQQNNLTYQPPEKYAARLREVREHLVEVSNLIGFDGVIGGESRYQGMYKATRALTATKRAIALIDEELTGKQAAKPAPSPTAAPTGTLDIRLDLGSIKPATRR